MTLKFEEIMEVPTGSSVAHRVYAGPNCRSYNGGAKDITTDSNYVTAGLFSGEEKARNNMSNAPLLGFFLRWPSDSVKESLLYTPWDSTATKSGEVEDEYGTIDLCVGVSVIDTTGKESDYAETYLMTTWDHGTLIDVRVVPLSQADR